jgi:hypothetical protein
MNCSMCNGNIINIKGNLYFDSKALGKVSVPGIEYSMCENCGDITIDFVNSQLIHKYIEKKENEAISNLPINQFLTLNEAAEILGVTKQAFSKNSRIKRGFIFSIQKGKSQLYLRSSVEAFKKNGKDGRILLNVTNVEVIEVPKYVYVSLGVKRSPIYCDNKMVSSTIYSDLKQVSIH